LSYSHVKGPSHGVDPLKSAHLRLVGDLIIALNIDSTVVRAHQHVAGARRLPSPEDAKRGHHIQRTRHSEVIGAA
jgi:hypothetical protein